jgi:hypothetical protein
MIALGWLPAVLLLSALGAALAQAPSSDPDSLTLFDRPAGGGPASLPPFTLTDPRSLQGSFGLRVTAVRYIPIEGGEPYRDTVIPPFSNKGAALYWHRVEMTNRFQTIPDANALCKPSWRARFTNYAFQFIQTPMIIAIEGEEARAVMFIYMDQPHSASIKPSNMGESVGHWEGGTLVVDTIGFNDRTPLDFSGAPHSARLHVVDRFRRLPSGEIELTEHFEDPVMYKHPWDARLVFFPRPEADVIENVCEETDESTAAATANKDVDVSGIAN